MNNAEAPVWRAPVDVRFGRQLRSMRLSRGYTQIQFANLADIDRSYCSDLERGVKSATTKTQEKLAAALGITIAELWKDIA
jgi:transcriptional regulator with XRE-family HTH domain